MIKQTIQTIRSITSAQVQFHASAVKLYNHLLTVDITTLRSRLVRTLQDYCFIGLQELSLQLQRRRRVNGWSE